MIDHIQNNHDLATVAAKIAKEIFDDVREGEGEGFDPDACRSDMVDRAWEEVDGCQHVIYTSRALSICANCDTSAGEGYLDDIYGEPFNECESFADVCTRLAFAVLYCEVILQLDELIDNYETPEETA